MEEYLNSEKEISEEEPINQSNQFNLSSFLEILLRRKKIFLLLSFLFFFVTSSNLVYRRIKNPIYRGSFTLMISDPFLSKRTQNKGIEDLALNKEVLDIPTLVQYLKSQGVVAEVAKRNNISPDSLTKRINITIPRERGVLSSYLSKTLLITVDGKDKYKMQKILEDLSKQYVINASESRNEKLSEGIKFLENEKPKLISRVKIAQEKLELFRSKNNMLDPIKEGEKITDAIKSQENKILALKSENKRLLFIKKNLVNGILYTQGIASSRANQDSSDLGIISSDQLLLKEILDVKSQLANAQSKYKISSTFIKNLEEKLSQLEPILLKNQKLAVDAAIIVNNSQIQYSNNQLVELKKKFIPIPEKVTQFSVIKQELSALEKNLQSLNETKDELELNLSQGNLPWKILVDPFVNPYPIKPDLKRNTINIILFTLGFASLLTFLIEKFDNVFHNPREVEKFINLPILGFVPFFSLLDAKSDENSDLNSDKNSDENNNDVLKISNFIESEKNLLFKNTKFIFEETFRNIYTSIKFSKSGKDIKIINITSSIPEEGKSLCSLFLAMNISQISKKVLIIDTDLRKPSLHKRLEVDNVKGISNYLVSNDSDWSKYINKHDSCENLSYITAGKIPPNSITLLESKKMQSFINELRDSNKYDFIILDCPPILGLSDALIISNYVDASILTISLNKVNKPLAMECLRKYLLIKKPIIGAIINSVSKELINKNPFTNNYYSYNNQYRYYAYKYMPQETQNRYTDAENIINSSDNIFKKFFKNKTFLDKTKFIFKNFKNWLDE